MKDLTAKIITIIGVNGMAAVSGIEEAYVLSLVASILILVKKRKTPHNALTNEIKKSLRYNTEDADRYAKYLEKMSLKEYQDAYEERTITKED